jgi:hypothetical protein
MFNEAVLRLKVSRVVELGIVLWVMRLCNHVGLSDMKRKVGGLPLFGLQILC